MVLLAWVVVVMLFGVWILQAAIYGVAYACYGVSRMLGVAGAALAWLFSPIPGVRAGPTAS